MFFIEKEKPKVGQTIFMILRDFNTSECFIKPLFITKVHVSKLTETPVDFMIAYGGYDEKKRCHIQTQKIVRECKNHFIVETRCGECIDFSTEERTSSGESDEMIVGIYTCKKSAKKHLSKLTRKTFFVFEETHSLMHEQAQ